MKIIFYFVCLFGLIPVASAQDLGFALMSAMVDEDGTLIRSEGADLSYIVGVGRYHVTFQRDIQDCAWVTSIAKPAGGLPSIDPGSITSVIDGSYQLWIETKSLSGVFTNKPFSIIVFCNK